MSHIAEGNPHWEVADYAKGLYQNWSTISDVKNFGP